MDPQNEAIHEDALADTAEKLTRVLTDVAQNLDNNAFSRHFQSVLPCFNLAK